MPEQPGDNLFNVAAVAIESTIARPAPRQVRLLEAFSDYVDTHSTVIARLGRAI
jgi:hypothetical protein